jgi:hypothetical protein
MGAPTVFKRIEQPVERLRRHVLSRGAMSEVSISIGIDARRIDIVNFRQRGLIPLLSLLQKSDVSVHGPPIYYVVKSDKKLRAVKGIFPKFYPESFTIGVNPSILYKVRRK